MKLYIGVLESESLFLLFTLEIMQSYYLFTRQDKKKMGFSTQWGRDHCDTEVCCLGKRHFVKKVLL